MSAKVQKQFDAPRTEKTASGLHPEQAALVALRQLIRDAQNGELALDDVMPVVIGEETRCGSTEAAAKALVRDILAGKPVEFARRNVGAKPRRVRRYNARPDPYWQAQSEARSLELSAWANGTRAMPGGRVA
jgi:hypothetical protein